METELAACWNSFQTINRKTMRMSAVHLGKRLRTDNHHLLAHFQTFGWKPDGSLSEDENFMDLTLLVTRSSQLKQGSMACILVRQASDDAQGSSSLDVASNMLGRIVSVSNNKSLFKPNFSDIHAEIVALGQAARSGVSTEDCSAYITMPPCKNCFGALLSAGVRRIVTSYNPPDVLLKVAGERGIEMVSVGDVKKQRARVDEIVRKYRDANAREKVELSSSAPDN